MKFACEFLKRDTSKAAPAMPAPARFPLLRREGGAALFQSPHGVVRASAFLAAATRLAERLPAAGAVYNRCEDRLSFALGFAAAMIAGCRSDLASDRLAPPPSDARLWLADKGAADPAACVIDAPALLAAGARDGAPDGIDPAFPPTHLAARAATSGSTGRPLTHDKSWGSLFTRSLAAAERFGFGPSPVSLVGTVPPQHMYGFETTVLLAFHAPVVSWCGPAFFPHDIAAALHAMPPPRVLVTTPLQIRALLEAGLTLPALALVISATAPLDRDLAARAEQGWQTCVAEIFGATEAGSIATRRTTEHEIWEVYPGLGLVAGADGVVSVTAPFAPEVPLADELALIGGTSFRLLGRRSDVVKLAGNRVSLASLTRVLTAIAGVKDGVFVAPRDLDADPKARLLAFAVAPGETPEAILAALRREIAPIFLPRRVVIVPSLPRNSFGKLNAEALAALAAGAR